MLMHQQTLLETTGLHHVVCMQGKKKMRLVYGETFQIDMGSIFLKSLENMPMQIQDKAKWTQARHAERFDRPKQITFCLLFPKRHNADTQVNLRKHEVTMLSNVNIFIVWYLSMQKITTIKTQTNGFVTSSHPSDYSCECSDSERSFMWVFSNSNKRHGPNSFWNRSPGDKHT